MQAVRNVRQRREDHICGEETFWKSDAANRRVVKSPLEPLVRVCVCAVLRQRYEIPTDKQRCRSEPWERRGITTKLAWPSCTLAPNASGYVCRPSRSSRSGSCRTAPRLPSYGPGGGYPHTSCRQTALYQTARSGQSNRFSCVGKGWTVIERAVTEIEGMDGKHRKASFIPGIGLA